MVDNYVSEAVTVDSMDCAKFMFSGYEFNNFYNIIHIGSETMLSDSYTNYHQFAKLNESGFIEMAIDYLFRPKLDILVDSSSFTTSQAYSYRRFSDGRSKFLKDSTYLKSRPAFIYNNSRFDVTFDIQDGALFCIQEAIDNNGNWQPIEYWCYSDCDLSYMKISLPSKYYIYFKTPYYNGDFSTKCRLKIRVGDMTFYSNVYSAFVNKTQFIAPKYLKEKEIDYFLEGRSME